ncbi:MAG: chromosome segregation protein SMC [Oscillospiraceae bacterium]|nr:chromosome segregation protein SMC [Oscillospiraceae bacterium]
MYLKSLELQGFKSFPDKIKLNFDAGITAVVGPNGSGKSNIGDAVRWVLGEQSTKTLRGNKMEDVIFSGTKQRKPTGFAAVTLNIDNHSGILGEEYGEEVSVTRKLYRSGESEYRINGKSVRLKDVNELFMDTGMGRDGYSIIGQGRIAEIVSAKSGDRRDIFEEAAGVSKFRYKKEEAQRRLASAEDNLSRLRDIAAELEGRVEPLRIQSEKAKKFLLLAEEQKQLEVSLWVQQSDTLRKKLDTLSDELLEAKAQYENIERDLEAAETKVQDGYRRLQESSVRIDTLREEIRKAEEETAQLTAALAVCENDVQHALVSAGVLEAQAKEMSGESDTAGKYVSQLLEKEEKLHKQEISLRVEYEQLQHDWERLEEKAAKLGEGFDETGQKLQNLYVQQGQYRVQSEALIRQHEEYTAQLTSGSMRMAAASEERETQLETTKNWEDSLKKADNTLSELRNSLQTKQQECGNALRQADALRTERNQIAFSIREKQQRKKLLTDMEQNMEGFAGSVKAVLRAEGGNPSGVHGTVAQCIETDNRCGVAIETALGGAMQNIIVDDESAAKKWIRFLAQHRAGRATFLPVTSVRGKTMEEYGLENEQGFVDYAYRLVRYDPVHEGIVRSLLGRIVVAENLDFASAIAKKYGYRFRIVTLDGQVVNAGGSFTGGSAQRSGGMITRKTEISALGKAVLELQKREEENAEKLSAAESETSKMQESIEELRKKCAEAESEQLRAKAECDKQRYLLNQITERYNELKAGQAELKDKISQTKREYDEVQEKLRLVEEEAGKTKLDMEEAEGMRNSLRSEQNILAEKRAQMRIQTASLEKDMDALQRELDNAESRQKTAKESAIRIRDELSATHKLIADKRQEAEESRQSISRLEEKRKKAAEETERFKAIHDAEEKQIRLTQEGMKATNAAKEKYAGTVTRLEERKISVQNEYDNIIRRLLEQYELTRTEAVAIAKPLEDTAAAQRELSSLKGKIRSLGSVNVAAIEEYKEVSERWKFLTEQMKDAENAKSELEKLICDLTEEMQRIFSESFAEINRNFREIFTDLFGGGEANLTLSDPDNVLESGIEIHVAPPGKVIKNLISLSGGEQSFVAIAIYFAILRLRPSPFCILDEIDAALDEGNVRRYAQYLHNFTNTTQFILVTHRRSAMEEAKVLYGVTMQENGVSKLLRMEQEEFEAETS